MLRWILNDQKTDVWVSGEISFEMGNDKSSEKGAISKRVALGLLGKRLGGKRLHCAGNQISRGSR